MAGDLRVAVVGVFYRETPDFADWLASVEVQSRDGVEAVPVIVVNHHPDHASELAACARRAIAEGRLRAENTHILGGNLGHTHAFNIGIEPFVRRHEHWPWIASLDPDARFAPSAIRELISSCESDKVGMISPLIIVPRPNGDFQATVTETEIVSQAGHFPFEPVGSRHPLKNYWRCHFRGKTVGSVREFLQTHAGFAPFTPCFCASVWKSQMFFDIGVPDPRQFRTLNCGEIGYRAELSGWRGAFSSLAIAFHPRINEREYRAESAIANPGCSAWHYFHAQSLIALRYFPDSIRQNAVERGGVWTSWEHFFPDLNGIDPDCDDIKRQETFGRWEGFKIGPERVPN